jgi:hypothetical protein
MSTASDVLTTTTPTGGGGGDLDDVETLDEYTILAKFANIDDPVEAEILIQGVRPFCSKKVWLEIERCWGQLLESAGRTADESKAKRRARKVASIDQETFDRYLATTKSPSRTGLLRYAEPPDEDERQRQQTEKDEQSEWLKSDAGRRWIEKNLYEFDGKHTPANAKKITPHGPITDSHLREVFDNLVGEIRGYRAARGKMSGSKRLRELKSGKRASSVVELAQLQREIAQLCVVLQDFNVEDYDLSDQPVVWRAQDIFDDLLLLGEWLDRTTASIQARLGDRQVLDRIAKLRDTTGRTPQEAETALRLAAQIERKMENRLG